MKAKLASGLVVLSSLASSGAASAQLMQPNGTPVPQGNNLVNILNSNGETINPLTDASTMPQTFRPSCALTFTVLGRGGSQRNSFGWYNVTGTKPALTELYEFIGCNDGVGTSRVLDIRNDPRWAGGEIGFFQATTEGRNPPNCVNWGNLPGTLGFVFYSEDRYNDDNNPTGPSFIHLLIMDSKVQPESFWFGWEDLFAGGDNDFEDLLMRVDGIQCSGGGEFCDTGQMGACAEGVTECVNGEIQCVQRITPEAETCNGIDDDCNGLPDDGDLCPPNEICDQGVCIPRCGSGEFLCPADKTCRADGFCVDPACESVMCPEGQVCVEGNCRGACDGVVCPYRQVCRSGRCVDPCDGVTCGAEEVCENGACINSCDCGGRVFIQQQGICVDPGCEGVACPPGQHCEGNGVGCVDDCAGAVCPPGQECVMGLCGDVPTTGTGGSGAAPGTGGTLSVGGAGGMANASGMSGSAGMGATAGTGGSGAAGGVGFGGSNSGSEGGCSCRTTPSPSTTGGLLLVALGLVSLRRRRLRSVA